MALPSPLGVTPEETLPPTRVGVLPAKNEGVALRVGGEDRETVRVKGGEAVCDVERRADVVGKVEGVTPSQAVGVANKVAAPLPLAVPVRAAVLVIVGGVGEGDDSSVLLGAVIVGVPPLDWLGKAVSVGARGVSVGKEVVEGVKVPSSVEREEGEVVEVGKLVMEPVEEGDTSGEKVTSTVGVWVSEPRGEPVVVEVMVGPKCVAVGWWGESVRAGEGVPLLEGGTLVALGKWGVLVGKEEKVGGAVPLFTPEGIGEGVAGWDSVGACVTVGAWGVKVPPPITTVGDTEGVARKVLAEERVPAPFIAVAVGKGAEMVEV